MNNPTPPRKLGLSRDERVLVIGVGRSGRASIEVLGPRVGKVYATDESPSAAQAQLGVPFIAPADLAGACGGG